MSESPLDICFVAAPFLPEHQPSLGISSLVAVLHNHEVTAQVKYLNLDYRARMGEYLYYYLSRGLPSEYLLGEMIFAPALWGHLTPSWEDYEKKLLQCFPTITRQIPTNLDDEAALAQKMAEWNEMKPGIRALFQESPLLIKEWAQRILDTHAKVVGFSSSFQQNIASLALAKELRRQVPREQMRIIFGGANCEGGMGRAMAENFPFIDHVVSGEGEKVILSLLKDHHAPRFLQGVKVPDMDALPAPNFDDYFEAVKGCDLDKEGKINMVAESSRGCWWGAHSQCSFCGLNGDGASFRSKNPISFANELRTLTERYGPSYFMLADNIMDMKYIDTLFPELISNDDSFTLFYETKSNLRKKQLEMMAAGGIVKIQPGIESLSTPVLKLMGKGTTRLQNLQLLKWCEEFHVDLKWNLLYGFPNEESNDYLEMAQLMPWLIHLPAPSSAVHIRIDRFGLYWKSPEANGVCRLRPYWAYEYCYAGLSSEARQELAYFFEFDYVDGRDTLSYAEPLIRGVNNWHNRRYFNVNSGVQSYKATLEIKEKEGACYILDTRKEGQTDFYPLSNKERLMLKILDTGHSKEKTMELINREFNGNEAVSAIEMDNMLTRFLSQHWLIEENNRYLSIVLNRSERQRVHQRRAALQLEQIGLPVPIEYEQIQYC